MHYRKIDAGIWNDEKVIALSVYGKLVWCMLLTHPNMTALGAMRGSVDGIVQEVSGGAEGLREAFREGLQQIIDSGMADYDPKASFIALPNFLKYNSPESPNVVKGWVKAAEYLPECELKTATIQRAGAFLKGKGKAFGEAFQQAFPKAYAKPSVKPSPNQRAENREQRADSKIAGNQEKGVHTRTRETVPEFDNQNDFCKWLESERVEPGSKEFDDCISKWIRSELTIDDVILAAF